ncbi:MAG: serine/threonine-protein kinase, partial [Gemmataceae bacterium]
DLMQNETALKRFQAEAEAVARINHPNIVQVYAIGEHDGLRYMALEYVEGRNLRHFLEKKGPPELPVALAILRQTAAALARASELGIVHRDIKPENILLSRKVEVKVTDFGLSRLMVPEQQPLHLTATGVTVGTPLYMAPEQVQGQAIDHRTDLYSFGVTAFHLLAGEPPFRGATAFEVAMKHVQAPPPDLAAVRPDLPPDLCQLVHRLLRKNPAERYSSARDVVRDLVRIREGLPVESLSAPGITLHLTQSGTGSVPNGSTIMLPVAGSAAPRWLATLLGLGLVVGLASIGWLISSTVRNAASRTVPTPAAGLPEVRLPERLISTTERETLATINSRAAKPEQVLDAVIRLGLLYIEERRLDEAEAIFQKIEAEAPGRPKLVRPPNAQLTGQFGRAIVLAYREKAAESITEFEKVMRQATRPLLGFQLQTFLREHPDLAEAISLALDRNTDNLMGRALPMQLRQLKSPGAGR